MKKIILSGMRPTGRLHLGHLVGALNNWQILQDEYDCFFMVADWHALLSEYKNPEIISEYIVDNVIDWLCCGINPQKATIFVQSHVHYHVEMAQVLGAITPLAWLERCPTYKEQLKELTGRELTTYGFLGYPVLQSADILLYKASHVPVGMDQLPHLELTREITRKFNQLYGNILVEPQPILAKASKLLGIDGRKMSKSYDNFIGLADDEATIRKKVQGMFTDPKRIKRTDRGHPEECNLCAYYEVFAPELLDQVKDECCNAHIGCTDDKKRLADILVKRLEPIRQKRQEFNQATVYAIFDHGKKKAGELAGKTMAEVRRVMKL
ncbi:MAG: tryptophan--tRNA ligase [Candidatus Omnitrophota bacterium]